MSRTPTAGTGDPIRLRDATAADGSALGAALADAASAYRPSSAQLDDLRRALGTALQAEGGGTVARASARRVLGGWIGALTAALLVAGGGTLGVWHLWRKDVPAVASRESATPAPPIAPPEPTRAAAPAIVEAVPGEAVPPRAPPPRAARHPDELALVSRAQRALAADPARALALAERHRRLYPDGGLAQEREVIAIEALRALGRGAEAKARARRFGRRYPGSAHLPRVEGQRL